MDRHDQSGRGRPMVRRVLHSDHDGLCRGVVEARVRGGEAGETVALQRKVAAGHEAQMGLPLPLP